MALSSRALIRRRTRCPAVPQLRRPTQEKRLPKDGTSIIPQLSIIHRNGRKEDSDLHLPPRFSWFPVISLKSPIINQGSDREIPIRVKRSQTSSRY
ncbi:unnamed protein product [Arabidopsis halleri]